MIAASSTLMQTDLARKLRKIFAVVIALLSIWPCSVTAQTWIDEDGESAVTISDGNIQITQLYAWPYSDLVAYYIKDNAQIHVCIGLILIDGMASDCFSARPATVTSFHDSRKIVLTADMSDFPFMTSTLSGMLEAGRTAYVTFHSPDWFASYTLDKQHLLKQHICEALTSNDSLSAFCPEAI